jgi:hypothetical protein
LRDILLQSNRDLLRDIEHLREALRHKGGSIPIELDTYYNWMVGQFDDFYRVVILSLRDLDSGRDDILPEILSSTQSLTQVIYLFNQRLLSPILRGLTSDRLCLKLLRWLHSTHPKTRTIPVALSDGDFASRPVPPWPTIYFMPPSAQQRLLYLPLFFHEFGHLLYASHKKEMDDLVRELQEGLTDLLAPRTRRDDTYAEREAELRSVIIETWYSWMQELFCDAVGFVIGGPAFAHAFSMHLRMLGRGQYHLPPEQLPRRVHPVTRLRMQLIAHRAREMGFLDDAKSLENGWGVIAHAMGVVEDYYGYYVPQFLPLINRIVDDMLVEAGPRAFTDHEVTGLETEQTLISPIQLLNQAWAKFRNDVEAYPAWEGRAIQAFLGSDPSSTAG